MTATHTRSEGQRLTRRALLGSMLILVAAGLGVWGVLQGAGSGLCGNDVVSEVPSPGGTHRIVVFQRDCGATTGFSTQVSLLSGRKRLPNEPGNLFRADTDRGRAPSGPGGGPAVQVRWLDEHRVLLVHHPAVRVFHAERKRDGVQVEYRTE